MGARLLLDPMRALASLFLVLLFSVPALGNQAGPHEQGEREAVLRELAQWTPSDTLTEKENSRLVSALLAVTLGPFGAHRLYLGTVPKVPIIYGVTFGGFGVLVLIDLGHLLFTRDLTPYRDNDRVFMWAGKRRALTPP